MWDTRQGITPLLWLDGCNTGVSCLVMVTRRVNEGMSAVSVSFVPALAPLIVPQSRGETAKASDPWSEAEVQVAGSASLSI